MRVLSLALLPFKLAWSLIKLLFWPALLVLVGYLMFPPSWFPFVLAGASGYAVAVGLVWRVVVRGKFASLGRGVVTVREMQRRGGR